MRSPLPRVRPPLARRCLLAGLLPLLVGGSVAAQPVVESPLTHPVHEAFSATIPGRILGGSDEALYLAAGDWIHGAELWVSRAGAAPEFVRELAPGGSAFGREEDPFAMLGGIAFFHTVHDGGARKLWRSDGTTGGTFPIARVGPHPANEAPLLAATTEAVYFASRQVEGHAGAHALLVTRGDAATPVVLAAFAPIGNRAPLRHLTPVGAHLYFVAEDAQGFALWHSDATAEGTRELLRLAAPSGGPAPLVTHGTALFYAALDGAVQQLWRLEAWASTPVRLTSVPGGTDVTQLAVVQGRVYFAHRTAEGVEAWATDPEHPEGAGPLQTQETAELLRGPAHFMALRDTVVFAASASDGIYRLYGSRGASQEASAYPLITVRRGYLSFATLETRAVYSDEVNVTWGTDGSPGGFATLFTQADLEGMPSPPVRAGALAYAVRRSSNRVQVLRTNGVSSDFLPTAPRAPPGWLAPARLVRVGGRLIVQAVGAVYAGDGHGGLERIFEPPERSLSQGVRALHPVGGRVLFLAGSKLHQTDGTAVGTRAVEGATGFAELGGVLGTLGNRWIVSARETTSGRLYTLDPQGHWMLLADVEAERAVGAVLGERLYFVVDGLEAPASLWVTDGTAEGTRALELPMVPSRNVELAVFAGRLYLPGHATGASRTSLWQTDGTAAGTQQVLAPESGPEVEVLGRLTEVDGRLHYVTRERASQQLRVIDAEAAAAGTSRALLTFPEGVEPGNLTPWNGELALTLREGGEVRQLAVVDADGALRTLGAGDAAILADPGAARLEAIPGGPLFHGVADALGNEPWMSCGEELAPIGDLHPGAFSSNARDFTRIGDRLAFLAVRGDGVQLWTLPVPSPDACAAVREEGSTDGGTDAGTDAGVDPDAGNQDDGGTVERPSVPRGCGCQGTSGSAFTLWSLLGAALLWRVRARVE